VELAQHIAGLLGEIEGVEALALGGSWARGEAHPDSDLDIGIYYQPYRPPSVALLRDLARELDDRHLPGLVTDFGEWGPWINGGGWLRVEDRPVDWLYRDLESVSRTIAECRAGRPTCHYQPGHPHGFHSHIYAGEVHYCKVLYDPFDNLAALKGSPPTTLHLYNALWSRGSSGRGASRSTPAASPRNGVISSISAAAFSGA
jgi:predicted nucleotidyltransferase